MKPLPVPVDQLVEQEMSEGLLLLRDTGDYVIINSTGRLVWKHLRMSRNLDSLLERLQSSREAPNRDVCRSQVLAFLNALLDAGFLEEGP